MSEKIAKLHIERDNDKMYYIKGGDVWAAPRKQPGKPKGKPEKVASVGLDLDYSKYLYYLDSDGDVARKERRSGGRRSKPSPKSAPTVTKASASKTPTTKRSGGKKTRAQLEREIEECLAKSGLSIVDSSDDADE